MEVRSEMRRLIELATAAAICVLFIPALAHAQATITGVVKDASGAVLPGATVEASSPALIEKVRAAVTDGTGQYRIENLRPGTYEVSFTLRSRSPSADPPPSSTSRARSARKC
jgi:hypothetical protein